MKQVLRFQDLLLRNDPTFMQYFSLYVGLPCFPVRLSYSMSGCCFEEFKKVLVSSFPDSNELISTSDQKDESHATISYQVKIPDRSSCFVWLLHKRLPFFLKSRLYAEYKLSKLLVESQDEFINQLLQDDKDNVYQYLEAENLLSPKMAKSYESIHSPCSDENCLLDENVGKKVHADKISSHALESGEKCFADNFVCLPKSINGVDVASLPAWQQEALLKEYYERQGLRFDTKAYRGNVHTGSTNLKSSSTSSSSVSHEDVMCSQEAPDVDQARWSVASLPTSYTDRSCSDVNEVVNAERCASWNLIDQKNANHTLLQGEEEVVSALLHHSNKKPVSLALHPALEVFKKFVSSAPVSKRLLLWLELERSTNFNDAEKERCLARIKESFMRSGAPLEISRSLWVTWLNKEPASLTLKELLSIRDLILDPILNYWCQRFTLHLLQTKGHFSKKRSFEQPKELTTRLPMPRQLSAKGRPFKATPTAVDYRPQSAASGGCKTASEFSRPTERKKARATSALPRLTKTESVKETNIGLEQLKAAVCYADKVCLRYATEAADESRKRNTRLYIEPVPPSKCNSSTVQRLLDSEQILMRERAKMSTRSVDDSVTTALMHEDQSGNFFISFIMTLGKQVWENCYYCWQSLQLYHERINAEPFCPAVCQRKANEIFASYLAECSPHNIQCAPDMRDSVYARLCPAYEELFDQVESYVLKELIQAWQILEEKDQDCYYEHVLVREEIKSLQVSLPSAMSTALYRKRMWQDLVSEESEQNEEKKKLDAERITPEDLFLPLSNGGIALESVLLDKSQLEQFKMYLRDADERGSLDLAAWSDMEAFRRLPDSTGQDSRDTAAMELRKKWLNDSYFFSDKGPATFAGQREILEMHSGQCKVLPARPLNAAILRAQSYCRARLEQRWLKAFNLAENSLKTKAPKPSVSETVEDMLLRRRLQRSESTWRAVNMRWNSISPEVSAFRLSLTDDVKCARFGQFLSTRGELVKNNLLFWLEVQKFKDLCHHHVEKFVIERKVQAICEVFIKSAVPPEVQIDVPIEVAERLYDRAMGRFPQHGPYLFREAQISVFRVLFGHWKDFVVFSNGMDDASVSNSLRARAQEIETGHLLKKMQTERNRLKKILLDNKRKDSSSTKNKQDARGSECSQSVASDDEQETRLFTYSKLVAAECLQTVETTLSEKTLQRARSDVAELDAPQTGSRLQVATRAGDAACLQGDSRTQQLPSFSVKFSPRRSASLSSRPKLSNPALQVKASASNIPELLPGISDDLNDSCLSVEKPRHQHQRIFSSPTISISRGFNSSSGGMTRQAVLIGKSGAMLTASSTTASRKEPVGNGTSFNRKKDKLKPCIQVGVSSGVLVG